MIYLRSTGYYKVLYKIFMCSIMNISDFHKIGGLHMLPTLLRSEHEGLRSGAAELVGTLTQNNPYCQKEVLEIGLLPILLQKLDDSSETDLVRIKSLFAVSCMQICSLMLSSFTVPCSSVKIVRLASCGSSFPSILSFSDTYAKFII